MAKKQDLIEKVIDPNQKLFGEGYRGVLVVKFWRFGDWVSVCIDDRFLNTLCFTLFWNKEKIERSECIIRRLPTKNGRLIFGSCIDKTEFWLALVEKAYAKLHGSYEALVGGHALEAFVDLTGGIAETIQVSSGGNNNLKKSIVLIIIIKI